LGLSAAQQAALQESPHEEPTIGILVVQVRRIRAISGHIFQRAACTAFVKRASDAPPLPSDGASIAVT
jgi:hypothetical protein